MKQNFNLTPHWKRIREEHPQVHAGLQWVAAQLYIANQKSFSFAVPSRTDLVPSLKLGFIQKTEQGIAFSNAEIFHDYLVRYAVEDIALPTWNRQEEFSTAFQDIRRRSLLLQPFQELANCVLLLLADEHGKNIVRLIADVAQEATEEQKTRFWSLYNPFCNVLPRLEVDPEDLARALASIVVAVEGDLTGGLIYTAVENLARRSQALSETLFTAFTANPESRVTSFAVNALVALSSFDFRGTYTKASTLLDLSEITLRRVSIGALGRLDYNSKNGKKFLHHTLNIFENLRMISDQEIDYVLARAYGDLLRYAELEASEALIEMSTRYDPEVQYQVASILLMECDAATGKAWYHTALVNLARVHSSHLITLRDIDYCVSRCVQNHPKFSLDFMEKFVLSRDYGREGENCSLPELLSCTYSEFFQHRREQLWEAITRWLASTEVRLHLAARDIIQHDVNKADDDLASLPVLCKTELNNIDEQTTIHVLHRILGHIWHSHSLVSLLISALDREPYSLLIADIVKRMLSEFVLYSFPGEAGSYLQNLLDRWGQEETNPKREVIRTALSHSESYFAALRQLPQSKELQPPSNRVYLLRRAQSEKQSAMIEEANKQSVFLSLVHRVPLKYGTAFFSETEDGFSSPTTLGSISMEWEQPRGTLIGPVKFEFNRRLWQHSGIDSTDLENQLESLERSDI